MQKLERLSIIATFALVSNCLLAADAPCSSWLGMSERSKVHLVSADVSNTVATPNTSELSKCVWDNLDLISQQATKYCQTTDTNYEVASLRAVSHWVKKCITEEPVPNKKNK